MSEDKTCPTCGRDDFKSRQGMKLHHSRVHDESIAGEEVECLECGNNFRVSLTRYNNQDKFFCSSQCEGHHRSDHEQGNYDVNCSVCGDQFNVRAYKYDLNDKFFCSKDCHGEWLSTQTKESHNSYVGRVTVNCDYCGDEKEVTPHDRDNQELHFCDEECMYDWRSVNWVGEDAPAWSGGTAPQTYGEGWTRQREKALERDYHRCRLCNISEDRAKEKHGEGLHVHHRTPFKYFDDPAKANRLRNLISLCKSCHHTLEWKFTGRQDMAETFKGDNKTEASS